MHTGKEKGFEIPREQNGKMKVKSGGKLVCLYRVTHFLSCKKKMENISCHRHLQLSFFCKIRIMCVCMR